MKRYIGVTGYMSRQEIAETAELFPQDGPKLMAGILASSKTLAGQTDRYPGRYPAMAVWPGILPLYKRDQRVYHLVHYCTDQPKELAQQLERVTDAFGWEYLDGFQLNMVWPAVGEIEAYLRRNAGTNIVLQVGEGAIREAGFSPKEIADRVRPYQYLISAVLLDRSGGTGKPLVTEWLRGCVAELYDRNYGIQIGVAGGLGPETIGLVEPLLAEFPLCIDAENQLRIPGPEDKLNREKTRLYIQKAITLFERYPGV